MTTGCKKLPCNHIFHTSCLRSWFQRQQTCPTCRMDVLRPQPPPQPQQPPPPQAPQPPFGFHPMGVPPPPMGIPPTPGVQPQGLQNGKNLLEMRLICACKNFMVVFCKTCILLPLTEFFCCCCISFCLMFAAHTWLSTQTTRVVLVESYWQALKTCFTSIIVSVPIFLWEVEIYVYTWCFYQVFRLIVQAHSHFIFSTHPLLAPQPLRSDCKFSSLAVTYLFVN